MEEILFFQEIAVMLGAVSRLNTAHSIAFTKIASNPNPIV